MPNDLVLKGMNCAHRALLAVSFGKLGWDAAGMPVLELTTTGRRSGQARSVMLTSPLQEGDTIVIVASRGGSAERRVAGPEVGTRLTSTTVAGGADRWRWRRSAALRKETPAGARGG